MKVPSKEMKILDDGRKWSVPMLGVIIAPCIMPESQWPVNRPAGPGWEIMTAKEGLVRKRCQLVMPANTHTQERLSALLEIQKVLQEAIDIEKANIA